jgi:8-oxo-dGTP diphosphatase
MIKVHVATKAFVIHKGKILLLRESNKYAEGTNEGKFDVPGGRLKPGEAFDEALIREVQEETGLSVYVGKPFFVGEWRPHVHGEQWQVVGIYFICTAGSDDVRLSADHDAVEWIDPAEYVDYPLISVVEAAFEAYMKRNED